MGPDRSPELPAGDRGDRLTELEPAPVEDVAPHPSRLPPVLAALRPHQWTKNAFVLAAAVYAGKLSDPAAVRTIAEAFVAFCLASSGTYVFNDLRDREADRAHPRKRHRPLASGALSATAGAALGLACLLGSLALSARVGLAYLLVVGAYLIQNVAYTLWLKRLVIIDVFVITSGFVLRAVGGAVALRVAISPWLVLCTVTLSLFLGFSKRRSELLELGERATEHRSILRHYTVPFLDQMISITATSTVLAYALYASSAHGRGESAGPWLMLTTPFVFYGIFRYLYLVHVRGLGADPARALLRDRALLVNCLAWAGTSIALLYAR